MSVTTSVRLDEAVKRELDELSVQSMRPRNWIINQALREYMQRHSQSNRMARAIAQCAMANEFDERSNTADWEDLGDEVWGDAAE